MKQFKDMFEHILKNGFHHEDRTGVGRISVHGYQMRFNLQEGFPLPTCKKTFLRGAIEELLWFIRGSVDNRELVDKNVNIWNEWAVKAEDVDKFIEYLPDDYYRGYAEHLGGEAGREVSIEEARQDLGDGLKLNAVGTIGQLYGRAWRSAPNEMHDALTKGSDQYARLMSDKKALVDAVIADYTKGGQELDDLTLKTIIFDVTGNTVDQLGEAIWLLKNKPYSSRIVVCAWIPAWIPNDDFSPEFNALNGRGSLAPCHCMFQFLVSPPKEEGGKKRLTCILTQRSADTLLGIFLNVPSYALLTMMLAQVCGMEANELVWNGGDVHIYANHMEQVKELMTREPRALPTMSINPEVTDILDFKIDDFEIIGYDPHPTISAPVAK